MKRKARKMSAAIKASPPSITKMMNAVIERMLDNILRAYKGLRVTE